MGAVAFLQHSIYGSQDSVRLNNNGYYVTGYSAKTEPTCVWPGHGYIDSCNISESIKPGNDGTHTLNYLNPLSTVSSTTGNYSGIYDMSGGLSEYVMGVVVDSSGNPMSGQNASYNSGFKGSYGEGGSNTTGYDWPEAKYYDTYGYATTYQQYQRRILGDATGEMGPFQIKKSGSASNPTSSWYNDRGEFIETIRTWFIRGGGIGWTIGVYTFEGQTAGIFSFGSYPGFGQAISYRIVLTP